MSKTRPVSKIDLHFPGGATAGGGSAGGGGSFPGTISDETGNAVSGGIHTHLLAGSLLPAGTVTGDTVRYNTVTSAWEVASEPLVFKGIVLTPALASLVDAIGAIYFDSALKAVLVCTDI